MSQGQHVRSASQWTKERESGDSKGDRGWRVRETEGNGILVGVCYCSGQRAQTKPSVCGRPRRGVREEGLNCKRLRDYNAETGSSLQRRAVNKSTKALLNSRFSCNSVHAHYAPVCNPAFKTLTHTLRSRTQMFSCLSPTNCPLSNHHQPIFLPLQRPRNTPLRVSAATKAHSLFRIYNIWHILFPVSDSIVILCQPLLSLASIHVFIFGSLLCLGLGLALVEPSRAH